MAYTSKMIILYTRIGCETALRFFSELSVLQQIWCMARHSNRWNQYKQAFSLDKRKISFESSSAYGSSLKTKEIGEYRRFRKFCHFCWKQIRLTPVKCFASGRRVFSNICVYNLRYLSAVMSIVSLPLPTKENANDLIHWIIFREPNAVSLTVTCDPAFFLFFFAEERHQITKWKETYIAVD